MSYPTVEEQYLSICRDVVDNGVWKPAGRTGIRTKAVISREIFIPVENAPYPVITTRQAPVKMPIAELLGYLKALDNAADFAKLGAKTWFDNANKTQAWLDNPLRKGKNDLGRIYGVQGRRWRSPDGGNIDQLAKIYHHLSNGIDDNGEIMTYWNPAELDQGCLRPCMHTHQFSLLGNDLYLDSYQRSADLPLGVVANVQQVYAMLSLMAKITNTNAKSGKLHLTNCHIYENQYKQMKNIQLNRKPLLNDTQLIIDDKVKTLEDIDTWVTGKEFSVTGYDNYHEAIPYPFAA